MPAGSCFVQNLRPAILRYDSAVQVRFWGVRGSVPWASASAMGYGCNTPCLEVTDAGTPGLLILDAGSGCVGLGRETIARKRPVSILLSHYHWDHIQGLPHFAPFFTPGWSVDLRAPRLGTLDEGWIHRIFGPPHFPLSLGELPSPPRLSIVGLGGFELGGFAIEACSLTHPGGAFAYRIKGASGDLVYATDHELGSVEADVALDAFALNAAVLVLDAQLTPEEESRYAGYGHSSWRRCAEFASSCGAGHLWLFHHQPGRRDQELTDIERAARRVFPATSVAREGAAFTI